MKRDHNTSETLKIESGGPLKRILRRDFLATPFSFLRATSAEKMLSEKKDLAFITALELYKIPKRQFLALATLISGVLGMGAVGVDQLVFDGAFQDLMLQALAKPELREKLLEIVVEGKAPQKLREEFYEKMTPYIPDYKLGGKENLDEPNLDKGFSSYEIRHVVSAGKENPQLLLIATLKKNGAVVVTEKTEDDRLNLTETQNKFGPFFAIPSSQLSKKEGVIEISTYSSYMTESGKLITYGMENKKISSGALVLLNDGEILVIDKSEIDQYVTGKNCKAIQTFVLAIQSTTLSHDMASIDSAMFRRTSVSGIAAVPYECFVATFYKSGGIKETKIISVYEPLISSPSSNSSSTNRLWYVGISIEQCVSVCKQLQDEGGFDRFTFIVPDPHYIHSKLIGPFEDSEKKSLRVFGKDMPGTYIEKENRGLKYYPPVFLALKLKP
ncbi:MAG: hypothetical protein HZA34_02440 [Candidatus Pacebacteria bacterium]|nr:hypothetical protein [Candidatus Paceibacterota bacterium]